MSSHSISIWRISCVIDLKLSFEKAPHDLIKAAQMEKSHGSACLAGWTPTSIDTLVFGRSTRLNRCSRRLFFYTFFEDAVSRMSSDQILIECPSFCHYFFLEKLRHDWFGWPKMNRIKIRESSFQVRLAISMLLGALLVAGLIAWEPKQVDFSEDFDGLWILMGIDIG